jgi:acyl-CoA thioesterase FadM
VAGDRSRHRHLHLNNAVYLTYFEWARNSMWLALSGNSRATDIGFIVVHAECDFHHQVNLDTDEFRRKVRLFQKEAK